MVPSVVVGPGLGKIIHGDESQCAGASLEAQW